MSLRSPITLRLPLGSDDCRSLIAVFSQGIDPHLEAITESGAKRCGCIVEFDLATTDIPVIERRLAEMRTAGAAQLAARIERESLLGLSPFIRAYLTAALFEGTDDDGESLEFRFSVDQLHPSVLDRAASDCAEFTSAAASLIDDNQTKAAHDFLLTRNRAGAGFWDGDWPAAIGKRLTAIAQRFAPLELYVGDDGLIHC